MTIRFLPDFLKSGDAALALPRRTNPRAIIGMGFPERPPLPDTTTHDPASAPAHALRAWLGHVEAGHL